MNANGVMELLFWFSSSIILFWFCCHIDRNGLNIRGYFVWAFLDVFELLGGYEASYGLYYIDLEDPTLRRQPKLSSVWYSNFLNNRTIDSKITMKIEENSSVLSNTPLKNIAT